MVRLAYRGGWVSDATGVEAEVQLPRRWARQPHLPMGTGRDVLRPLQCPHHLHVWLWLGKDEAGSRLDEQRVCSPAEQKQHRQACVVLHPVPFSGC